MAVLRFLSRVTFICNICYLLASFIQWLPYKVGELVLEIAAQGYLLAIGLNVILNAILVLVFVFGKLRKTGIPIWLMIVNFLFLLIQITVIIINLPKS